ncbi:MAG TPA: GlsB/YeaQ/YmgE family stress response membrane protein [Trebonia sp.]
MGVIAWIILGLGAGLIANMFVAGRRSQGLILTCIIGIIGALGGGWAAIHLFHVHTLNGFFNLSTWITAIVGAAILLLIFHLFSRQSSRQSSGSGSRRRRYARR